MAQKLERKFSHHGSSSSKLNVKKDKRDEVRVFNKSGNI